MTMTKIFTQNKCTGQMSSMTTGPGHHRHPETSFIPVVTMETTVTMLLDGSRIRSTP